jgi:hypothetical protein
MLNVPEPERCGRREALGLACVARAAEAMGSE